MVDSFENFTEKISSWHFSYDLGHFGSCSHFWGFWDFFEEEGEVSTHFDPDSYCKAADHLIDFFSDPDHMVLTVFDLIVGLDTIAICFGMVLAI